MREFIKAYTNSNEETVLRFVADFADELNAYRNLLRKNRLNYHSSGRAFENVIGTVREKPGYTEFKDFITRNGRNLKTLINGKAEQEKLLLSV